MVLLFVIPAITATAQTETKHLFSAKQAIEYAQKNNVQVKNALLNIEHQKQVNREVTAAALPSINGSIQATDYFDIPTQVADGGAFGGTPGTYQSFKFGLKYNNTTSLQLQQLLFDGQVFVGLQARKTAINYQVKAAEVTEEAIKANIYKIYYQLVASNTQISLLDANIARLEKLKHDATEMFKNGFSEKLDIDRVVVQLSNLQTAKISTLNTIGVGYLGLKTLMGMPIKDNLVLTDTLSLEQVARDFSHDTSYQYTDRKEFQYLSLAKQLNEYNIKRYKLSYLPTVALTGLYGQQAYRNEFTFFSSGDWYPISYVGVNIGVPIFNGFSKRAKVEQSKIELKQTENQIDNLKITIDQEVSKAQLDFTTAVATLNNQKENMQLAESVYNQTKKKYEAGTGSNTEITSAQTDLISAQTNFLNALYDAIIAKVDYLKATGRL
jgi:outer membrane protein TolC